MPTALLAGGFAALVMAAPVEAQALMRAAPMLVLPLPEGKPDAIDFGADPLLGFLAQGSDAAGFRAAIKAAVAQYPAWGEAEAVTEQAQAARREARSALFPALGVSLIAARSLARDFEGNSAIVESLVPRGRTDAQISADQLLWDFGATSSRIAGASARIRAARAEAGDSAATTALAAIAAWYQVLGYQSLADLSDALVERHRGILADTRTRAAAGLGTGGDTARAEATLAEAIGAALRNQRSLTAVRARYRVLFGREAPARPERPDRPVSVAADAAAAAGMSHNVPAVRAAMAAAEAGRAEARAVRGDTLPRLSGGVAGTRYDAFGSGSNYDVRGQLVLRQSLSVGGAETARVAQARARARGAEFAGDRVVAEAERAAETAFADDAILGGAVPVLGDSYRANRRARDAMAEQFRLSRGSLIELLRAEQDYFAAAQALLQGNIERDVARYTLMARTGELLPLLAISFEIPAKGA
ncbi:hypothetical protein GCM10011529_23240 [Polymorphobacter glacialis]|uniref:Type I secretion protein TolC n=1 Tax=Sandarakinorhabdus glacialis TaxID=1614636 RepID=A0A917EAZ7_9SPHN|nr:TolC family protein [Polymorphobacter glacialis]GGE16179.1 hypothetical protein GCM10011529_23240 [Polymorphobacter glacialis]